MSQFKYEDPDLIPRIHLKNQTNRKARHSGDPLFSSLGEALVLTASPSVQMSERQGQCGQWFVKTLMAPYCPLCAHGHPNTKEGRWARPRFQFFSKVELLNQAFFLFILWGAAMLVYIPTALLMMRACFPAVAILQVFPLVLWVIVCC